MIRLSQKNSHLRRWVYLCTCSRFQNGDSVIPRFRRRQLPKLKSEPPMYSISPYIERLLGETILTIPLHTILRIAETIQNDVQAGYKQCVDTDRELGGVGFHNINRREGKGVTGNYRTEFRPIFRPLQYACRDMFNGDLIWNARHVIQWSCAHVEDSIKYRFHLPENDRGSLGQLLTRRPIIQKELEPQFLDWLRDLNTLVYRNSKHSVEELTIDAHRFTPADAVAVYLMCRWAGVVLLEPTGLFNDWMGD